MNTIGDASQDASFEGRLYAWRVAFYYARDHFPFGAGLYGPQLGGIFHAYFPKQPIHAAHSIYFEVLGENGFIGFFLYLGLIICGFLILLERHFRMPTLSRLPVGQRAGDRASVEPFRVLCGWRRIEHGLLRLIYCGARYVDRIATTCAGSRGYKTEVRPPRRREVLFSSRKSPSPGRSLILSALLLLGTGRSPVNRLNRKPANKETITETNAQMPKPVSSQ